MHKDSESWCSMSEKTGLLVCMYVLSRRIHVFTCFSVCITVVLLITHVKLMLNVVSCVQLSRIIQRCKQRKWEGS